LVAAPAGGLVRLLADDPLARIDVPHFAASAGATVLEIVDVPGGAISFLVAKAP
jgi:tRNA 2-thiouridine synthesizing protein A